MKYRVEFNVFIDMNMSYRLAFCKTMTQFMSHKTRRQLPRRKRRQW